MAEPVLWWRYSLTDLITDAILNGPVTLHVDPSDTPTGRWYVLTWVGEDQKPHEVNGQTMEIVLRRAAEKETAARAQAEWDAALKTPDEWLQTPEFADVFILDPDGWRNPLHGLRRIWHEPLPLAEFRERLALCTIGPRKAGEPSHHFIVPRVPADKMETTR